jgi:hypothetical protein
LNKDVLGKRERFIGKGERCALKCFKVKYFGTNLNPIRSSFLGQREY